MIKKFREFMWRDIYGQPLTDDMKIVFLELSKTERLLFKPVNELSGIEMWALFLRYASDSEKRETLLQILNKEEGIKMAANILEEISKDERERMLYESQIIYEADQKAELSYMVCKDRKEVALNMLSDNVSFDLIFKYTGISKEELTNV